MFLENKHVNTANEKKNYVINDKVEQDKSKNSEYEDINKDSKVIDVKDYFQIEFVNGAISY